MISNVPGLGKDLWVDFLATKNIKHDTHSENGGFSLGGALGISEGGLDSDGLHKTDVALLPDFVKVVEVDEDRDILLVEIGAFTRFKNLEHDSTRKKVI